MPLLNAAGSLTALMGEAGINILAIRGPIQVTALGVEVLINEADAVLKARSTKRSG